MEYYYLNYFEELKGWSKDDQLSALAKARYCAFKEKGLLGKSVFYCILSFLLCLFIIVPGTVFLTISPAEHGYIPSIILSGILFSCGIIVSIMMYRKLYGKLIYQGLLSVLSDKNS